MKKIILIISFIIIFALSACENNSCTENCLVLPDLTGKTRTEIIDYFGDENFYFHEVDTDDSSLAGLFAGYVGNRNIGDEFNTKSAFGVEIYRFGDGETGYFTPIELTYDGPYLDEQFASIDYMNPRGGYFEVTLSSCTDGDTARFNYPQDIYDAITSGAKSVRFLNMDTEETFPGGREEWGKPGSLYTCGLLHDAVSIVLQTDPGDGLTDTYGRLLSWVWIQLPNEDEYFLLNYMIVQQGLAQVKYEFGAGETISYGDYTYNEWMHRAEDYAQANKLGQWGDLLDYYWNYEDDEPFLDRWN